MQCGNYCAAQILPQKKAQIFADRKKSANKRAKKTPKKAINTYGSLLGGEAEGNQLGKQDPISGFSPGDDPLLWNDDDGGGVMSTYSGTWRLHFHKKYCLVPTNNRGV